MRNLIAKVAGHMGQELPKQGCLLEEMTWLEAEEELTSETVIVIPLGAAAKEHGPHLKLSNDWLLAEFLKKQVVAKSGVVVAPTVSYHYYPAFVDYPGSISLREETACNLIIDICVSLSKYGPKRFYVINTGISTLKPLAAAAEQLATSNVLLRYTDFSQILAPLVKEIAKQEGGSHADEIETSIMLYIQPSAVDMSKAVKDYNKPATGPLSRKQEDGTTYSPTGIWGDPTLASSEKGKIIVEYFINSILAEIESLRSTTLPLA